MTDAFDSSPHHQSAGRGAAWSAAAFAMLGAGQLIVQKVLDPYLTKDEWGVFGVVVVVIGLGKIFTMSGVGPALVQRKDLERRHIETGFLLSMMMGLAAVIVLSGIAPLLGRFFDSDQLVPIMRVISFTFLIQAAGIVAEGLLQRSMRLKQLALAEITSFIVGYVGVGVTTAVAGAGVWSLVWANLAQASIKVVLILLAARHPMGAHFDRRAARELAGFASGFTLAKVGNYSASNGDNIVVGRILGTAPLGFYFRAYQLLAMPAMLFGQVLDRVLFPMMARLQDDTEALARTYRRGVAAIVSVTGPAGALIVVLAPEVLVLLGGDEWGPAVNPLRVFAAGLMLRTGYKISDALARSAGTVFKRAKRQWIYAAAVVVGAFVGGKISGITGAAVGVLGALTLNYMMMADLSLRTTKLSWASFAEAHRRGVILGLLTFGVASAVATPLRHGGAHYLVTIAATLAGVAVMFGALIKIKRDLVLGDVEWLLAGRRNPASPIVDSDGFPQVVGN